MIENMETKTIEEMKAAVLAYCERFCPNEFDTAHLEIGMLERRSLDGVFYWLSVHGLSTIAIHNNSYDDDIFAAYRLLGLEARDAVEAERAKAAKLVEAIRSIQIRAWDAFNKVELAAVQKGAVGRIKRQYTPDDTNENDLYMGEILDAKRVFDAQVNELIEAHKEGVENV